MVKKGRSKHRRTEQSAAEILESMSDAFVALDREWRYTYVNSAAERLIGLDREEMLGRTVWELFPQQGTQFERALRRAMGEGMTVQFEEYYAPLDKWLEDTVYPSADGITVYARDITERKRAEEMLKQSQSQLAEAQHLAQVGSWNWDLKSNTLSWSDEHFRIFGLQPQAFDPVFEEVLEYVHPEDRDLIRGFVESSITTHEPFNFYYRVIHPGGEVRIIHSHGNVISDRDGIPVRMFGTAQDVTERKRAEEQLNNSNEKLRSLTVRLQSAREEEGTRIAREIHDELGSALTSLRWDLEGFDKVISESEEQSQLHALRGKLESMIGLTDITISTVRRISSELRPSVLDDLGLVEAIEWQAQQFHARTGIICQCDCSLESLNFNQEQSTAVFRIFQEALTNILRHAQATSVDIKVMEEAGEFILMISDNGRGITEDEKAGQFSLGLLGMRERAHLIGGEISITGVEGKGTVVTIRVAASD